MRLIHLPLLLPLLLGEALAADSPATLPEGEAAVPTPTEGGAAAPAGETPVPATESPAGPPVPATAPPPIGEALREAELRNSPVKSEIRELQVSGKSVLTLYRGDKSGKPKGTVLLLHDVDGHADWPAIIAPLRGELPSEGWSTLSLQLPIPTVQQRAVDHSALIEASKPRLRAAIADLQQRGEKNVVLAGYGLGALTALHYLTADAQQRNPNEPVSGLVIIAIRELTPVIAESDTPTRLAGLQIPILDIYASSDIYSTVASAEARASAVRKSALERKTRYSYAGPTALAKNVQPYQLAYRQYPIAGADHAFTGQQPLVARTVRGWLDRQTRGNTPKP